MSRYDDLSPRALWFLQNFDELTLAEMCAADEAASQATAARVRHVADQIAAGAPWTASHTDTAARVRDAVEPPPVECPPGVHSMFDPCPGDCSKPLNEPPTA